MRKLLVVQGDQLNMAVFFWYLVKSDLSSAQLYTCTLDKSHFKSYQKNTALFNWLPCSVHLAYRVVKSNRVTKLRVWFLADI